MIDKYILFRGKDFIVNDKITIHQPTLDEIFEFGEQKYYSTVLSLVATPFDYKVQLFDINIDYETMSDYELFILLFKTMPIDCTSILFGSLDFNKFELERSIETNELYLFDKDNDIIIDKSI